MQCSHPLRLAPTIISSHKSAYELAILTHKSMKSSKQVQLGRVQLLEGLGIRLHIWCIMCIVHCNLLQYIAKISVPGLKRIHYLWQRNKCYWLSTPIISLKFITVRVCNSHMVSTTTFWMGWCRQSALNVLAKLWRHSSKEATLESHCYKLLFPYSCFTVWWVATNQHMN